MHDQELRDLMGDEQVVSHEELATGGFSVIDRTDGGMTAHRGPVQPDLYIEPKTLRESVESALGFTHAEVTAAYQNGRPTAEQREQRARIDARMLALSRGGGNMALFARVFDLSEKTIDRAVARARLVEVVPMVATGVVRTPRACFSCGDSGATPRKRRFSKSPPVWTGTVDLCGPCYSGGFAVESGNPAYWDFRRPGGVITEARAAESRERIKRLLEVGT